MDHKDKKMCTLVADTGIQLMSFPISLDTKGDKKELIFRESISDTDIKLELLHELYFEPEDFSAFYMWKQLSEGGFLAPNYIPTLEDLAESNIDAIWTTDQEEDNSIFKVDYKTLQKYLHLYENKWMPIPYYLRFGDYGFDDGPYNWVRMKLIPIKSCEEKDEKIQKYNVVIAFDTRVYNSDYKNREGIYFLEDENSRSSVPMRYGLCSEILKTVDFCGYDRSKSNYYIYDYLFHVANPDCISIEQVKSANKLEFVASYIFLINILAEKNLMPDVLLYRDGALTDVDLVVDIGNSRTMAILVEDGKFERSSQLELLNFTTMLDEKGNLKKSKDGFDMQLAFRKVDFATPLVGSQQFVYPSLVRLGPEATYLIRHANQEISNFELTRSTNSSPKRYLWDDKPAMEPWKFITLEGEQSDGTIVLHGITEQLQDNGRITRNDTPGGIMKLYSRQSLMTLAFLEILSQARMQSNSHEYRKDTATPNSKRVIKRIVVTCPTAWSKMEREALVTCAKEASELLKRFYKEPYATDVIPVMPSRRDDTPYWYYDEATCSQLVYMYGEIYKYQKNLDTLFNLFGKKGTDNKTTITVGSIDIGAGTTDLMIGEYSYEQNQGLSIVTPNPRYYDSFYYAGDDMLKNLIQTVLYVDENSTIRKKLSNLSQSEYLQKLSDTFGPDYAGQINEDRQFRMSFNLQYAVPLMSYFLHLNELKSEDRTVGYKEVFGNSEPSLWVKRVFEKKFGFQLESLEWDYKDSIVSKHIFDEFEPLLKMIATIMNNSNPACDIVLLSGRPASLPAIRNVILKYYPTSPDRVILVNNHYVGKWYPFSKNTGYITDPKTIVAVGALIGLYGSRLNNLDSVRIDTSKLERNLKSTVNYIRVPGNDFEFIITPEKSEGTFCVAKLPVALNIQQLGVKSYISRPLYVINFDRNKMADSVRRDAMVHNQSILPNEIRNKIREKINKIQLNAPFNITIAKSKDDKEDIEIVAITDSKDTDLRSLVEIHTQSMGTDNQYWLDTGTFVF